MRRITLALVSTIAVLVLLFSYRTSTSGPADQSGTAPPGIVGPAVPGASAATGPAGAAQQSGASTPGGTSPSPAGGPVTVNGTVVDNGYGPVQVQASISGGKIVELTTLALPGDGHSRRINSYAVPQLRTEALRAQSAQVDTVSGATATSDAYRQSLQAALDAAHLGKGS